MAAEQTISNALTFDIVPKGTTVEIKDKAGQAINNAYVGAGWDMGDKPVDLDLVAACLSNGKLTATTRLVYFNDRTEPGVTLSEDNRTGAGDGDDESLVLDLSKVESDVDSIAIGVCAYAGADLAAAKNFKLRIVNGLTAADPQVLEVQSGNASTGDTVLHAANLKRGTNGWTIENVSAFYKKGNGADAIKGFAGLFA
jgi:stress response protein SCP2